LITTIEACIDIAQHLCSTESLGTPTDNGDAVRRIGDAGIIDNKTASAMVSAVGIRDGDFARQDWRLAAPTVGLEPPVRIELTTYHLQGGCSRRIRNCVLRNVVHSSRDQVF
jgi:hypothetical protein